MKILALNTGSSSIKYTLFDASSGYEVLRKGGVERIGQKEASLYQIDNLQTRQERKLSLPDYRSALHAALQDLASLSDPKMHVDAIGHRVVHGGKWYRQSARINDEVMEHLKEAANFAPLHSTPNLLGIEVSQQLFPDIPHAAVFDTAAHAQMPPKAFLYGLPLKYYEKHQIRRYGFHGINHAYVAQEAAKILNKPLQQFKVVSCHLGNGCSITAFKNGMSIDNSMGLTPLEGLVMGSRSGNIDPAIVLYLIDNIHLSPKEVSDILNKKSGLLGLCGKSDMRDILAQAGKGDEACRIAVEVFVYNIQKTIGAFIAALNGVDVMIFTGGIGENSAEIRELVLSAFSFLGVSLDPHQNQKNEKIFSALASKVTLLAIPANEELVIAEQTKQIARNRD